MEGRAASTRELLAKRIIEMAEHGESDPRRFVDDALAHLAAVEIKEMDDPVGTSCGPS